MSYDVGPSVVERLGWELEVDETKLAGAASGAGVYRVRLDGRDAVLKVTAGVGQQSARRELAFYRTLADRVPVVTPQLLRYADNDEFTAIVLSAHTPAPPAHEWDQADWLEVVRQLAALHSMPVPAEQGWTETPWLRETLRQPPVTLADKYWSTTSAAAAVAQLLSETAALARDVDAVPDCFLHGDCHADNLLRDGDNLIVWADWQSTGVGAPAAELALLWTRAHADGAVLPYDAMLHEYADRRGIDVANLRQAVRAAELAFLLFAWPDFANYLPQSKRDRLTSRLLQLTYWES
jgi:aminoglycoside phosphotransferase (APT) family kinase protein